MEIKRINLALQGGGAHGAYTWGVLDRLLEDDRVEVEAVSGTSAGAMNAAVFADGMGRGGREASGRSRRSGTTSAGPRRPVRCSRPRSTASPTAGTSIIRRPSSLSTC